MQHLVSAVASLVWDWKQTKDFVEKSVTISSDSLHVLGGVVVMLGAALLLRKPLSSLLPWLVVLALICINEAIDLQYPQWKVPAMDLGESAKDLMLTMALPTMMLVFARLFPRLWSDS